MDAADGIKFLGVLAVDRERFSDTARLLATAAAARTRLYCLTPGFFACPRREAARRAVETLAAGHYQGRSSSRLCWRQDALMCPWSPRSRPCSPAPYSARP
jgi:hypothetical protein